MENIIEKMYGLLSTVRLTKYKAVKACNYQDAAVYRDYEKQLMAIEESMHQLENMRDDRPSVSHDDQADAPVEGDHFDDNAPNGED